MIRRSKLRERPGAEARSDYARLTRPEGRLFHDEARVCEFLPQALEPFAVPQQHMR